jgi:hypothetical protein
MAALKDIVIDARHPASIARFWAEVLDDYEVAPYDEVELARLRGNGIMDPEDDPTVLVQPSTGAGPRYFFQAVPESKSVKNRLHLDLRAGEGDLERVLKLGASIHEEHDGWTTLRDPEGNEFCLIH